MAYRLAAMMFLQYAGLGAWVVPVSHWLGTPVAAGGLGFSPSEIGAIYSTVALAAMCAPLITGFLADRTFASERIIAFNNAAMAVLLVLAGVWGSAGGEVFYLLFAIMFAYALLLMSAMTIGTAMTMRTLTDPPRQFGRVRLFGTLGWVVTVALIGLTNSSLGPWPFYLGAMCHAILATGFRWLPHTPPLGRGRPLAEVVGLPALKLFRDPSFIVFVATAFVANMMQTFYSIFANVCCYDLGMWKPEFVLTSSQWVEMACMASIPVVVASIGLKATLALGVLMWAARCAAFATTDLTWIVLIGIPLQGVAYTYFSIVGSLYIDREAPPHLRAGAQGLMTFISGGPGTLIGNMLSGFVVSAYTTGNIRDWHSIWLVPTIGCGVAFVFFVLLFREPRPRTG